MLHQATQVLANIATRGMTGIVVGASGFAGFVTHANRAMETIQASAALSALHEELGAAPPSRSKAGHCYH